MTWNIKYRVIKLSSMAERCGMPSKRASRRKMIGSNSMRIASSAGGKIPEMMPTMTDGRSHSHASQLYVAHSECTFDTIPTKATADGRGWLV